MSVPTSPLPVSTYQSFNLSNFIGKMDLSALVLLCIYDFVHVYSALKIFFYKLFVHAFPHFSIFLKSSFRL